MKAIAITILAALINMPALAHEVDEHSTEASVVCDFTTITIDFPALETTRALKCNFEETWNAVYGTDAFEVTSMAVSFAQQRADLTCTSRGMKRVRYLKNGPAGGVENFAVANSQNQQQSQASVSGIFYCVKR